MRAKKQTRSPIGFELDGAPNWAPIQHALAEEFALRVHAPCEREHVHLDTFDWRLHTGGLLLFFESGPDPQLVCHKQSCGGRSRGAKRVRMDLAPVFSADLPDVRRFVVCAELIGVRRLLPVAQVQITDVGLDVLDGSGETVARVIFRERHARSSHTGRHTVPLAPQVILHAVRGHDDANSVALVLEKSLGEPVSLGDELEQACAALDKPFGIDPARLAVDVARGTPSARAAKAALAALFKVMLAVEDGTRAALDPEFLHDFRVAVRRTRSLLGEMTDVFPSAVLVHYGKEFKWLGRVTGRARDLDVFLEALPLYTKRGERDALEPLFEHLAALCEGEQERLEGKLNSARFTLLKQNWSEFLDSPGLNGARRDLAEQPIETVIGGRILARYRRLLKTGKPESGRLSVKRLHAVRIQGKRLRYSMQLFRCLFAGPGFSRALRELKALQDLLGEFNDLSVHEEMLVEESRQLAKASGDERLRDAASRVAARMTKRRKVLRRDFEGFRKQFAKRAIADEFDRIGAGERCE